MNNQSADSSVWIKSLGDVFLGLNNESVIQRVLGVVELQPALPITRLQGLTWAQFVDAYAHPSARAGLNWGWQAMVGGRVARLYWPTMLPFTSGVVARIRPVEDDPSVSVAVHLRADSMSQIDTMLDTVALGGLDRMARLTLQLSSGTDGPLTDRQVADVRSIIQNVKHTQQFIANLRAEMFSLAVTAPYPQSASTLLDFSTTDFMERRITTHRLRLEKEWSSEQVYCQNGVRQAVQQLIYALFRCISEETAIRLDDRVTVDGEACLVRIRYHSHDPEMRVTDHVLPLTLGRVPPPGKFRSIDRLITAIDAWLRPLNGCAWVEPCSSDDCTAAAVLMLPRWKPLANTP